MLHTGLLMLLRFFVRPLGLVLLPVFRPDAVRLDRTAFANSFHRSRAQVLAPVLQPGLRLVAINFFAGYPAHSPGWVSVLRVPASRRLGGSLHTLAANCFCLVPGSRVPGCHASSCRGALRSKQSGTVCRCKETAGVVTEDYIHYGRTLHSIACLHQLCIQFCIQYCVAVCWRLRGARAASVDRHSGTGFLPWASVAI